MPTPQEMTELSFRQLCKRLLDVDPECSVNKGCPAHYVAFPMLNAWLETHEGEDVPEIVRRMEASDGQGRSCEIDEIQYHAKKFLKTNP